MKRVAVSAVLVVMVVAAALAIGQLGLFKKPSSAKTGMNGPTPPGHAGIAAPTSMTTLQIATLLAEWTYPGAKDVTGQFILPKTKMDSRARKWTFFATRSAIYGSPARVRRFYADKLKVGPDIGSAFAGVPMGEWDINNYADAIQDGIIPAASAGMENDGFSLRTSNYLIRAVVSNKAGQKQTTVTLIFFPCAPVISQGLTCITPPVKKSADTALALPAGKKRRS